MNSVIDPDFTGAAIIHGDLLHILPQFPDGLFGGIRSPSLMRESVPKLVPKNCSAA